VSNNSLLAIFLLPFLSVGFLKLKPKLKLKLKLKN